MKYLIAAIPIVLLPCGVLASDLSDSSGAALASTISAAPAWAGLYGGVHTGFSSVQSNALYDNVNLQGFDIDIGSDGPVGGFHVGYNHPVGGNVLMGLEGSVSLLSVDGRMPDAMALAFQQTEDLIVTRSKWALAVGPRVGFDMGDLMPFISGGYAVADSATIATALGSVTERTLTGWYMGLGVEYRVRSNVSLKVDYATYRFNSELYDTGTGFDSSAAPTSDTVRIGLNIHFGG